jgi:hypothetical protein
MVIWPHVLEQDNMVVGICGRRNSLLYISQKAESKTGTGVRDNLLSFNSLINKVSLTS